MYKLRKNIFLGLKWSVFWFVLLGFISISILGGKDYKFTIFNDNKIDIGIKALSNEEEAKNDFQNEGKLNLDENKDGVVRIYDIERTFISKDESYFYFIETDDRYIALEAKESDPEIIELLNRKETLKDNPKYLELDIQNEKESRGGGKYSRRRTVEVIPTYLKLDLAKEFAKINSIKPMKGNKNVIVNKYLSLTNQKSSIVTGIVFAIIISVINLLVLWVILYKIKENINSYRKLEDLCPEIKGDYKILDNNSSYNNKYLKILVYNDILIFGYKKLQYFELDKIKKISIDKIKERKKNYYMCSIKMEDNKQYNIVFYKNLIKANANLEEFYRYIFDKYPNVGIIRKL